MFTRGQVIQELTHTYNHDVLPSLYSIGIVLIMTFENYIEYHISLVSRLRVRICTSTFI